jgi:sulfonate transport system substrate-binding protein
LLGKFVIVIRHRLKIAVVLAAIGWSSAPLAARADDPQVIRLGSGAGNTVGGKQMSTGIPGWTEKSGVVEKEFAGSGIKIEWIHIPGAGPGANEALASGKVDFAYYGDFPAIIGKAGGVNSKLIVPGQRGANSYLSVPPSSTVKDIADLKGKRLAINLGRPWELAFSHLLASKGLALSDFQIFNLSPPDGAAAIAASRLDGLYDTSGFLYEEKGVGRIVWSTRAAPLDWKFTSELFASADFAAKYPAATERVAKAFIQAAYLMSLDENRDDILRFWGETSDPYSVELKEYEGVPLKQKIVPLFDPFLAQHYREAVAYAVQTKLIRKPFDVDGWFDPRFVETALKELKLENYWPAADASGSPLASR